MNWSEWDEAKTSPQRGAHEEFYYSSPQEGNECFVFMEIGLDV